jgi:hypothetical protein
MLGHGAMGEHALGGFSRGQITALLTAVAAAYVLTGQAAFAAWRLVGVAAAYVLTGMDVVWAITMAAVAAAYTLAGQAAAAAITCASAATAYTLTGLDIVFQLTRRVAAEVASFVLSGYASLVFKLKRVAATRRRLLDPALAATRTSTPSLKGSAAARSLRAARTSAANLYRRAFVVRG